MAKTVNKSSKNPKKTAAVGDLFASMEKPQRAAVKSRGSNASSAGEAGYTARHIEVLEGLEPVRRRPGMYIGGTDEKALHHLFAEVIDNAMDEALAGHATFIEVELEADGFVSVTDNGRGIPVDPHPKFKNKSALEVIMCTLHAGGKFDSEVYETSGGLHGVGVSVANALSDRMEVEVARGQKLYKMVFERGKPKGKLQDAGKAPNRRGTTVRFHPDPEIFGPKARFQPEPRVQDDALQGLSVRRCRDPLVLRQGVGRRHRRAGQGHVPFRGRAEGLSLRDAQGRDTDQSRYL
jgi:topoisomerase-4 subunit B